MGNRQGQKPLPRSLPQDVFNEIFQYLSYKITTNLVKQPKDKVKYMEYNKVLICKVVDFVDKDVKACFHKQNPPKK